MILFASLLSPRRAATPSTARQVPSDSAERKGRKRSHSCWTLLSCAVSRLDEAAAHIMCFRDPQQDLGEQFGSEHAHRVALVASQQLHRERVLVVLGRQQQQRLLRLQRRLEAAAAQLAEQEERVLEVACLQAALDAILVCAGAGLDGGDGHAVEDGRWVLSARDEGLRRHSGQKRCPRTLSARL